MDDEQLEQLQQMADFIGLGRTEKKSVNKYSRIPSNEIDIIRSNAILNIIRIAFKHEFSSDPKRISEFMSTYAGLQYREYQKDEVADSMESFIRSIFRGREFNFSINISSDEGYADVVVPISTLIKSSPGSRGRMWDMEYITSNYKIPISLQEHIAIHARNSATVKSTHEFVRKFMLDINGRFIYFGDNREIIEVAHNPLLSLYVLCNRNLAIKYIYEALSSAIDKSVATINHVNKLNRFVENDSIGRSIYIVGQAVESRLRDSVKIDGLTEASWGKILNRCIDKTSNECRDYINRKLKKNIEEEATRYAIQNMSAATGGARDAVAAADTLRAIDRTLEWTHFATPIGVVGTDAWLAEQF